MDPSSYHTPVTGGDTDGQTNEMNTELWGQVPRCHHCCSLIYDPTLVSSGGKCWHKSCFRCSLCSCELEEAVVNNRGEIYCKYDFDRLYRSPCASCSLLMEPSEFVRRIYGNLYHEGCFKCVVCQRQLHTGDRVYLRDDSKLVCQTDYQKIHKDDLSSDEENNYEINDQRMGVNITTAQADILTSAYEACAHPSRHIRQRLSNQTGLNVRVIQKWFRNKRKFNRKRYEQNQSGSMVVASQCVIFKNGHKTDANIPAKFEWLTSAFAADFVPPNVDLSPQDIRNGEVCTPLSFMQSQQNNFVSYTENTRWNPSM